MQVSWSLAHRDFLDITHFTNKPGIFKLPASSVKRHLSGWQAVALVPMGPPQSAGFCVVSGQLETTQPWGAATSSPCYRVSQQFREVAAPYYFLHIKSGSTRQNHIICEVCRSCSPPLWEGLSQTLHCFLLLKCLRPDCLLLVFQSLSFLLSLHLACLIYAFLLCF